MANFHCEVCYDYYSCQGGMGVRHLHHVMLSYQVQRLLKIYLNLLVHTIVWIINIVLY